MPAVSAVLIALDEAHRIAEAIRSVRPWVDEVLVLDGGSRDDTVRVARSEGARVETHRFDGFVTQKQRATNLARHRWIVCIDADERVDAQLGGAISKLVQGVEPDVVGFRVRRRNYLDGRALVASGWYPDVRVRIFDRERACWGGLDPHDHVIASGRVVWMEGHLHHDPDRTTAQLEQSTRAHAQRASASLVASGWRPWPLAAFCHAAGHFLRKVLLRAAWLDGRRGWRVAWVGAKGVALKYKLAAQARSGGPRP
ncbi:MAG: hypothetical protein CL928_09645 [Deltaproteobacteria bacterium]|mgnify:CR=1 FL=1|nr:hypothetical protein [Deltaproteobacteria bacterium]